MKPEVTKNNNTDPTIEKSATEPSNIQPTNIPTIIHKNKRKKIFVILGLASLGLAALFIIGLVVLFVVVFPANNRKRNAEIAEQANLAPQKVASARSDAEKSADKKLADRLKSFVDIGLVTEHLSSSKIDVCYISSQSNGTVTEAWYQDCYLRYVEGFNTEITQEAVKQKIEFFFSKEFKSDDNAASATIGCSLFGKDNKYAITYRPMAQMSNSPGCEVPDQLHGLLTNVVQSKEGLSTKIFYNFDETKINNVQSQLWLALDENYYHEELGCGTGWFCDSPRSKPIQAP